MTRYFSDQRREYRSVTLTEVDIDPDPVIQFQNWMQDAIDNGLELPNAMVIATVSADGKPAARYVLLKEVTSEGFVFYTHSTSDKGKHLATNTHAALVFYWQPLHRQVRIEGSVSRVSDSEADDYFKTRPYGSRLSVWVAPQSSVVPDRGYLESRMQELEREYPEDGTVPRPETWTGYRVAPVSVEFWQGRENRLHDRILYRLHEDGWSTQRLAP